MNIDRTKNLCRWIGYLVSPFFLTLTACGGQTNVVTTPFIAPALPDAGVSLLRVAGAMVLVIGIFLGGVWMFKNWRRLALQQGRGPKLQVLETRPLGGRNAIYVLAYEQQRFLVSASPSGVSLLSHLPAATDNEAADGAPGVSRPAFTQVLAQVLKGK
ncbi:MAG TPA: flagellar biosynthetic protein FliO [Verrucomicrobiae bacterium]|jgi:flagellar biogenesis protein FliO|nr:flagellar biosynthetic protein FliO [Verrucomicrobiae bacterium]